MCQVFHYLNFDAQSYFTFCLPMLFQELVVYSVVCYF
uniref:Uncharacterized protein n=1 Tax=Rhizophora mucronata TaxID=61149 RepID=A0A2P2P8V6_RHIMU